MTTVPIRQQQLIDYDSIMRVDELGVLESQSTYLVQIRKYSQRRIRFRASLCGSFAEASMAASIDVAARFLNFDWLISSYRGLR
jgi:hypothetical protein